jgi:hypothetical protein
MGEEDWLHFFSLMGSAIALREHTPLVPNTPLNKKDLTIELRTYVSRLDVISRLRAFGAALRMVEEPGIAHAHYFLLKLDPNEKTVTVHGFKSNELNEASKQYLDIEQSITTKPELAGSDAVLVSVESLEQLRRAYPNYFLDTTVFIDAVDKALE